MNPSELTVRKRWRQLRPRVEGLESRELLSYAALVAAGVFLQGHHAASVATPDAGGAAGGGGGSGSQGTASGGSAPTAPPTPHEARREAFHGEFSTHYVVGPGRFLDQASRTFFQGAGNTSAFLHGNFLMAFSTPGDSTLPITGQATLISKNVSNTGSELILDLTAPQGPGRVGRPTHFTWTVDPSSGGTFLNSTGQGTLDIIYLPGGKRSPGTSSDGVANLLFLGSVNTTGVNDITRAGF